MAEWIYGRNAVYEVLRARRRQADQLRMASNLQPSSRLEIIKKYAKEQKIPVEIVEKTGLNRLANGHQGVALRVAAYPYSDIGQMLSLAKEQGEKPFLLLLDTLKDPQNLGSLLRSAEAVGVHGVILPHRRTATVTPAVVNVSSGASEHLLISQQNLAQAINLLKDENIWVIGLDGSNEAALLDQTKLTGSLAIVVGSEGEGMRKLVRESCDLLVRIPMYGRIESLNAAVAGSVVLYLASQGRKTSPLH